MKFFSIKVQISPILLASMMLAGCRREAITVQRVPKEKEVAAAETSVPETVAQTEPAAQPQIHWKTPPGWREQTAGAMSVASFSIGDDAKHKAELSIMKFPGAAAGELSLVNIVRENAGLPPIDEDELAKIVEPVNVGGTTAKLIDLTGATKSSGNDSRNRILVAVYPHDGLTWFFKLAGDAPLVTVQKPAFIEFLNSVSFDETAGESAQTTRFASTNTKHVPGTTPEAVESPDNNSARPVWDVPAGWTEAVPSQMVLAKFAVHGGDGDAEISVSSFPGDVGGLLANVNRWRGQVNLAPVNQSELAGQIGSLDVMGGKAMLVDVSGQNSKTGKAARLIGVIWPRNGQTWFYKLVGDPAVAEREKDAFVKFVQSVRYPNA